MPRTTLLPTPASSTDIQGQDGSKMASLQLAFELPPPAVTPGAAASASKPVYPLQPSETVKSRRRSSGPQGTQGPPKEQFALPPPPTRSRKIIQMKPREEPSLQASATNTKTAYTSKTNTPASSAQAAGGTKKKQPSSTSAAGRKIARKTAHSLIERRRRSKMNDEFAVLKSMIPACSGEMHKLAILQASIEYVRYLEDCVAKLKARQGSYPPGLPSPSNQDRGFSITTDAHLSDVEMTGSSPDPSPAATPNAGRQQQPPTSPVLPPDNSRNHRDSYSSVSTDHRHHSFSTSATTSPTFGPQSHGYANSVHSASGSALTSPALPPQRDLDQEATAALLMLNQTDRRGPSANNAAVAAAGRGMSVKDLLST
ncbi:hypothetical protein B0H67DRAFT_475295 [Lasiosphaeris hirsuta]|uniref:BHLH domain-containing protein n=1 Tax=Lasiosphaeris hirsuta TaxID=260670 RepID=A0AA40BA59_9PEZI|nr:hypothetical protein B0H67DRAFT_475295 [Lasiosphaeris hirsuta]